MVFLYWASVELFVDRKGATHCAKSYLFGPQLKAVKVHELSERYTVYTSGVNFGTLGGNVLHRSDIPYSRADTSSIGSLDIKAKSYNVLHVNH